MYDGAPYVIIGNSIMPLSSVIALEREEGASAAPTDPDRDGESGRPHR
ncbi:MAG: hypothetical protein ACWGHP_10880 [Stenotrophomonas sp.]